jgi:hypothetical protein
MERPPGRLLAAELGPERFMGPEERPMGAPMGMEEEGMDPWGAFRQACMRFLPSGCVTRGWSLAVVKV